MSDVANDFAIVRALLTQINVIAQKNRETLTRSEWGFNVFRLCGVYHYENANSRILAEFLNPHGSHGMGSAFIELFLSKLEIPFVVSKATEVKTELAMEYGRMDIVICDHDLGWCVVIENKIYAAEQEDQLCRYWKWLTSNYHPQQSRLLFLTLSGYASGKVDGSVSYMPISYARHVIQWLDGCIMLAAERPFVRETLRQYCNHIKCLTGMSMEKENLKELIGLLTNADNFEAVQIIHDNYGEVCQRIAAGIFLEVAEELKGVSIVEMGTEAPTLNSVDEGFRFIEPNTGVVIRTAPAKKGYCDFFVGLTEDDAKGLGNALRKKIDDSWEKDEWWPAYKYLPDEFRWWSGDLLLKCLREKAFRKQLVDAISSLVRELCTIASSCK